MRPSLKHTRYDALHNIFADHNRQCSPFATLITAHLFSIIICICEVYIPARKGQGTAPPHGGHGHDGGDAPYHAAPRQEGHDEPTVLPQRYHSRHASCAARPARRSRAEAVGGVEGRRPHVGARRGENG